MVGRSASHFLADLDAILASPGEACVLRIDLDRFARIRNTHGAATAAVVLTALEARMTVLADANPVVRLSEGSYALIFHSDGPPFGALRTIALDVMHHLSEPVEVPDGPAIAVGCNVGLACSHQFDVVEPIRIVAAAEEAVQSADRLGSRRAVVYEPSEHRTSVGHLPLYPDMLPGILKEEFDVYFQPLVTLPARQMAGVEALVRWQHPHHGLLLPADFMREAEESGLVRQIDALVRRRALAIAAQIFSGTDLRLSINVSAADLDVPDLGDDVLLEVMASGLQPEQVTIEVTETALAAHWETAQASLIVMKNAGMRIAMDDFGTGHMYLDRLSTGLFDLLKIDRSLIVVPPAEALSDSLRETRRTATLTALVDLAHAFDMAVVAEGVETEAECARAVNAGCDYGQGYLFARPGDQHSLRNAVST